MALEDLMKEVSSELERLVSTKTVVGDSMVVGDTTIIPVTKVSFGFGTGGGEGKKKGEEEGFGGGGGAGAKIEPVAFIVISPEGTKLMTLSGQTDFGKILESVPGLIEKVKAMKKSKKDDSCADGGPCESTVESSED